MEKDDTVALMKRASGRLYGVNNTLLTGMLKEQLPSGRDAAEAIMKNKSPRNSLDGRQDLQK